MTHATQRFDRWLFVEYRASARDLALGRIILGGYLLALQIPQGDWVHALPQAFYNPPISIAALFADFASEPVMVAVNFVAFVAAACLAIGYRTPLASVATTLALITLNSLVFATGKIDHNILLVLAPAMMATSGWGAVWSADAHRSYVVHLEPDRRRPRWQLAWLAAVIALAMATAAFHKADSGWLHLGSSSAYGHGVANALLNARPTTIGDLLLQRGPKALWEAIDWATIAVEGLGLFAVWRARWFRAWCAALVGFHVAIHLVMDISFTSNLIVYGLFAPWSRMIAPLRVVRHARWIVRWPALMGMLLVLAAAKSIVAWSVPDGRPLVDAEHFVKMTTIGGALPVTAWAWWSARSAQVDRPDAGR